MRRALWRVAFSVDFTGRGKLVVFHAERENFFVALLQLQRWPAMLTELTFRQVALQEPELVVSPSFNPYVGSRYTLTGRARAQATTLTRTCH